MVLFNPNTTRNDHLGGVDALGQRPGPIGLAPARVQARLFEREEGELCWRGARLDEGATGVELGGGLV